MTHLLRLATPLSILVLSFSILVASEKIGSSIDTIFPIDPATGRIKIDTSGRVKNWHVRQ